MLPRFSWFLAWLPSVLLGGLLGGLSTACTGSEAPAQPPDTDVTAPAVTPPEDAVVQIGPSEYLAEPRFILASEIDRWVETVSLIEPAETRRSWRRKALTNINLPIAVAAAILPEERLAAREEAAQLRELLVAGRPLPSDAPPLQHRTGHCLELGLPLWGSARELAPLEWSSLVEVPGGFAVLRRLSPDPDHPWRGSDPIEVELLLVPYLSPETTEAMIADARPKLGVHALNPPGWDGILPAFYEYE